jgi:hypothetical protein
MNFFLHVGYPKTGSTWLINNFLIKVTNITFYKKKYVQQYFLKPNAFDFNPEIVTEMFNIQNEQNVWLSDENLIGGLKSGGLGGLLSKEVANRLKLVFPNAKIIIFIRNQIDNVVSSYLQYIKSGGNYGLRKFLFPEKYSQHKWNNLYLFNCEYFLYDKILEYYADLFGRENLNIFLFEEFCENTEKFISEFASRFELKYDRDQIDYSIANMSYRWLLMHSRRFLNCFSSNGPLNKYYLVHIPGLDHVSRIIHDKANNYRIFGPKLNATRLISKNDLLYLINFYSASNNNLYNNFGINSLKKYNYPLSN